MQQSKKQKVDDYSTLLLSTKDFSEQERKKVQDIVTTCGKYKLLNLEHR